MKKVVVFFIFSFLAINVMSQKTGCVSGNCDNGYGTWVYKSGAKYVGYYKNMKFQGKGTYYYSNGDTYKGYWKNDVRSGFGEFYNKATGDKHSG